MYTLCVVCLDFTCGCERCRDRDARESGEREYREREGTRARGSDGRESRDYDSRGGGERKRERSAWDRDSRDGGSGGGGREPDRGRRRTGGPNVELTPEQQKQLEALQQAEMQRQLQRQQACATLFLHCTTICAVANVHQELRTHTVSLTVTIGNCCCHLRDLQTIPWFEAALYHPHVACECHTANSYKLGWHDCICRPCKKRGPGKSLEAFSHIRLAQRRHHESV